MNKMEFNKLKLHTLFTNRLLKEAKMSEAQKEAEAVRQRLEMEEVRDREALAKAYREQDDQDNNKIR